MTRDTVVLTGATGFVGRRLVRRLARADIQVALLLRDPTAAPPGGAAQTVRWDMTEEEPPDELLRTARAVVHLAAFIPADLADPASAKSCFEVNAIGSLRLLRAAAAAGVPAFINFSSGNVYQPRAEPVDEDAVLYPSVRAPYYLTSKLAQEVFADHVARSSSMRVVTLRPSGVYGPGMRRAGVVYAFASQLLAGQSVRLHDGGRYGVDLVYVDDVVAAAHAALNREVSGAFNVGSGHRTTVFELAASLRQHLGVSESLLEVEPEAGGEASGFAALDIARARRELAYEPTDLAVGLPLYLDWLRGEG